jgi:hypothetical protein
MFICVIALIASPANLAVAGDFHRALIESPHLNDASLEVGVAVNLLRSAVGV